MSTQPAKLQGSSSSQSGLKTFKITDEDKKLISKLDEQRLAKLKATNSQESFLPLSDRLAGWYRNNTNYYHEKSKNVVFSSINEVKKFIHDGVYPKGPQDIVRHKDMVNSQVCHKGPSLNDVKGDSASPTPSGENKQPDIFSIMLKEAEEDRLVACRRNLVQSGVISCCDCGCDSSLT